MRQLIIARKDLQMSPGKLAAQCCHASIAFLTSRLRDRDAVTPITVSDDQIGYVTKMVFTKTICEARNRNHLMKAIEIAKELGLEEGRHFFLIKDCCLTELAPEEVDENGVGRTLTCIGFIPMQDDIAHQISKKFQLYR